MLLMNTPDAIHLACDEARKVVAGDCGGSHVENNVKGSSLLLLLLWRRCERMMKELDGVCVCVCVRMNGFLSKLRSSCSSKPWSRRGSYEENVTVLSMDLNFFLLGVWRQSQS